MPNISSVLHSLMATVTSLTAERTDLKGQVHQLHTVVQTLETQLMAVQGQLAEERRKILLGQLAYVIDTGAAKFVYGPGYRYYTSFRDLEVDMRQASGSQEVRQRWGELCAFFHNKGLAPNDVTGLINVVRQLRFETAHGSEAEKASTTLGQLQDWAQQLLEPQSLNVFNELLDLATCFSSKQQPLVPATHNDIQARVRTTIPEPRE